MNDEYKTVTVVIPLELYCKIKAASAFQNLKLKYWITEVLYHRIKELENEKIIPVLDHPKEN